ncbi:MAG: hypothetical protein U5O16_09095 [Rhodococcus sp. (in: high G+C Gram-positive bacteria)]|uniref:hypothetical protein n=1 Tax=Rhodococcus sp. TaxID=1831 RepID=UPI002AD9A95B|nr:hypothetical protein [Rhodococcus sp. (in: high G+C Gram-positive bacteria)]
MPWLAWCGFSAPVLGGADDEGARGGVDDVGGGDGGEVVDFHDAFDLREKLADETEVPCCQACDGGDGLGVGEVVGILEVALVVAVVEDDLGEDSGS